MLLLPCQRSSYHLLRTLALLLLPCFARQKEQGAASLGRGKAKVPCFLPCPYAFIPVGNKRYFVFSFPAFTIPFFPSGWRTPEAGQESDVSQRLLLAYASPKREKSAPFALIPVGNKRPPSRFASSLRIVAFLFGEQGCKAGAKQGGMEPLLCLAYFVFPLFAGAGSRVEGKRKLVCGRGPLPSSFQREGVGRPIPAKQPLCLDSRSE